MEKHTENEISKAARIALKMYNCGNKMQAEFFGMLSYYPVIEVSAKTMLQINQNPENMGIFSLEQKILMYLENQFILINGNFAQFCEMADHATIWHMSHIEHLSEFNGKPPKFEICYKRKNVGAANIDIFFYTCKTCQNTNKFRVYEMVNETTNATLDNGIIDIIQVFPKDFDIVNCSLFGMDKIPMELAEKIKSERKVVLFDGKRYQILNTEGYNYIRYRSDIFNVDESGNLPEIIEIRGFYRKEKCPGY